MSYFLRAGNTFRVASEEPMDLNKVLPVGNYAVKYNQMNDQFYLEMVDAFPQITKLYGDTTRHADRILKTFMDRTISTGVMLNGEKGSGKTLLAVQIALDMLFKRKVNKIVITRPTVSTEDNGFLPIIEPTK